MIEVARRWCGPVNPDPGELEKVAAADACRKPKRLLTLTLELKHP